MSVPITGVHHVALLVDDLGAARLFYGDVMGLPEIADRPDFNVDGAWFQLGANQLHIIVGDGPPPESAPQGQHFAVQVSDLDAAVASIEAHGVSVLSFGGKSFRVQVIRRFCVTRQGTASNLTSPSRTRTHPGTDLPIGAR